MRTATHLPFRAGHKLMRYGQSGCMGDFGPPCFLFSGSYLKNKSIQYREFFQNFLFLSIFPLETEIQIGYTRLVYAFFRKEHPRV